MIHVKVCEPHVSLNHFKQKLAAAVYRSPFICGREQDFVWDNHKCLHVLALNSILMASQCNFCVSLNSV